MSLKFHTEPWEHQIKALEYLMPRSYGALYIKPGAGKTKVMIDLILNRGFKRTIIVATNKICRRGTWDKEIAVHSPEGSILALNVSKIPGVNRPNWVRKNGNLNKKPDQEILIVNYESIWREPFKSFLLKKYNPDCVICDESHRIKSPGSKCSKMLNLLGRRAPNRFLMTGTPLAERPLDVYAQYRFLCSDIFGTNFETFKEEYSNRITIPGGIKIPDKKNPYKNINVLQEKMFSCAFTCEVELNLPNMKTQVVEFELSAKAEKYYKELRKDGCLELKKGTLETSNVLTVITREQQLTSGYIPLETPEGETVYEEVDTSRQETFEELLEGIPPYEPVVVWCKYRRDIKNIRKICRRLERPYSELSGKADTMQDWVDDKTKVLIIQISSGAEGLNDLVKARYCIYYTLHPSLMLFKQSRARLKRPGQKRSMVCYVLVAKMSKGKTIDERIWEDLKNKRDVVKSIMSTQDI